jgi:hypothetical protein
MLGDEYTDQITGFRGRAIARTEFIVGCNQVGLVPPVTADKPYEVKDATWFDEERLLDSAAQPVIVRSVEERIGGPSIGPRCH